MDNPFQVIETKLNSIEALLLDLKQTKLADAKDALQDLLTVEDTAKFLTLSVQTVYSLISRGELPVMKRSKRCYFMRQDLIDYLKKGRKMTNEEFKEISVADLLIRKRGGRK